jgi:hypothetical protein
MSCVKDSTPPLVTHLILYLPLNGVDDYPISEGPFAVTVDDVEVLATKIFDEEIPEMSFLTSIL